MLLEYASIELWSRKGSFLVRKKYMIKTLFAKSIFIGFTVGVILYGIWVPQSINADLNSSGSTLNSVKLIKNGHLTVCKLNKSSYEVIRKLSVILTAYSSSLDETWGDGLITASGKHVADGIVATNYNLPFGTKIRIPSLYGNKVFVIEDRMHPRKKGIVDIWMPTKKDAKEFGVKFADIEIIES